MVNLIEKIEVCGSAIDFYKMKNEILAALKEPVKEEETKTRRRKGEY